MRKLYELLPLARQYLITQATAPIWEPGGAALHTPYVCNAAHKAAEAGGMTKEEAEALACAVVREIDQQSRGRHDVLCPMLAARHGACWHSTNPNYLPHRDLWLDEFQLKLERTKQ